MNKNQIAIAVLIVVGLSSNVYLWSYRYDEGFGIGYADGSDYGFNTGYSNGQEDGFRTGYANGTDDGFRTGYNEGEMDGYNDGNEAGFKTGYGQGYSEGETEGYATGYSTGENDGLTEGYNDGYSEGSSDGYSEGRSDGFEIGNETGWEEGYHRGLDEGAGHGWTLRDPSYSEMRSFILRDRTDRLKYVKDVFECVDFSAIFITNAREAGLQCYYVEIKFPDSGHAIVAFNTTDRGLKYIEPQSDETMNLVIGRVYWPRKKYYAPTYDDTILKVTIVP